MRKKWSLQNGFLSGNCNIINDPLVKKNVLLPLLHIKLGLTKQYIKSLKKDEEAFLFIKQFFPKMSDAKLKAGILIRRQIRKLLQSEASELIMTVLEKSS